MRISGLILFSLAFFSCSEEKPSETEKQEFSNTSLSLFQKQGVITTFLYYKNTVIYDAPKVNSIIPEENETKDIVLNFMLRVKNNTNDTIKEITWICETWGNFLMEPQGIFNFSPNMCYANGIIYRILPPNANTVIPLHLKLINKNFSIENVKFRIGYFFRWGFKGKSALESWRIYNNNRQVEIPTYWSNIILLKDEYKMIDSLSHE